ncbi:hypothetical protein ACR42A_28500 [Burkholderia gladioli]|uniref:hypothetical protein n=1 Tax=Burkholderia gladioli TaxID=28095 RepID=UPI001641E323|nr:hypothetical protein [Burkholderia gladioli]MDN7603738.1 hypothetical protein [Burkholderia gladioli]
MDQPHTEDLVGQRQKYMLGTTTAQYQATMRPRLPLRAGARDSKASYRQTKTTMKLFDKLLGRRRAGATAPTALVPPGTPTAIREPMILLRRQRSFLPLRDTLAQITSSNDPIFLADCLDNHSGHVREAALRRSAEIGESSLLALVAACLNDWVPQVRDVAIETMDRLLAIVPVQHFVVTLQPLRRLLHATRLDHRAWLLAFEQRYIEAGGAPVIIAAMNDGDHRMRRVAYSLVRDHRLLSQAELIRHGLTSGDVMLSRQAFALLGEADSDHCREFDVLLPLAAASPFGTIRYAAFELAIQRIADADIEPLLWRAATDTHQLLRLTAARRLNERGHDVAGHFRSRLDSSGLRAREVRSILSLLIDLRVEDGPSLMEQHTRHPRAEIRAHALALLAKVTPSRHDELAARALLDPSAAVRGVGVRLCLRGAYVSLEQIETMLARHGDYRAALRITTRSVWDRLACLATIAPLPAADVDREPLLRTTLDSCLRDMSGYSIQASEAHRRRLSDPAALARLFELADERQPALRVRLREAGITLPEGLDQP